MVSSIDHLFLVDFIFSGFMHEIICLSKLEKLYGLLLRSLYIYLSILEINFTRALKIDAR